jgi:hypothetical protein
VKPSAILLAAIATLATTVVYAHHSFSMFDQTRVWTWEGTVHEYQWKNPHIHILIDVPAGARQAQTEGRWDFEGESTTISGRQGWTRKTFTSGDKITIVGHPLKTGDRGAMIKYAVTGEGTVLYHSLDRNITPENTPR